MTFDDSDKAVAAAFETAVKAACIDGVPGFTASVMTSDQYAPTGTPGVAPTLPRDFNRDTGLAVSKAISAAPLRVLVCVKASMPAPVSGGVVFVRDGAAGAPVLAFSDGYQWLRCDTLAPVS